jgi:hypothetical protein
MHAPSCVSIPFLNPAKLERHVSIANIICQGPVGYLLSDSGYFWRDGRIARMASKVLELPLLRAAIVARGHLTAPEDIGPSIHAAKCRDVFELVNVLPSVLYELTERCGGTSSRALAEILATQLSLVYYCPTRKRVAASIVASNAAGLFKDYEPFTHLPVLEATQPGVDVPAVVGRAVDLSDPVQFDVEADGMAIMEAQRSQTWSFNGLPSGHHAAGSVRLTQVDCWGVRSKILRTWPDRVGERVRSAEQG